jgi:uncharacterized protein GlcG (DUF336 family)
MNRWTTMGFALLLAGSLGCATPPSTPPRLASPAPSSQPPAPPTPGATSLPTCQEESAGPVAPRDHLTTADAARALQAALAEIARRGGTGAVAVADDTGHLVAFARADGTFPAGALVSSAKARTAALFRAPTRKFEGIITGGRAAMMGIEGFMPMTGGVPIVVGGRVIGAVGVAGAAGPDADEAVAKAAVSAFAASEVPNVTPSAPKVAGGGLSIAAAFRVQAAAEAFARGRKTTGGIAIVDQGGHLVAFKRVEGTFVAGDAVSIGKARTSALFQKPTRVFEKLINDGRLPMLKVEDFMPMQGGIPLVVDGKVIGAIGVSGASSAPEDEEIAIAGAAAIGDGE